MLTSSLTSRGIRLAGIHHRCAGRNLGTTRELLGLEARLVALDDPTKVIGRMTQPVLAPNEEERAGYVPNVNYSCGYIVHRGELVLPYAMSDSATSFASINLEQLYRALGVQ